MTTTRKEIGVLFKPEMIQAIMEGRKTMTRRVIKPQPEEYEIDGQKMFHYSDSHTFIQMSMEYIDDSLFGIPCRYSVGDLMYVKEAVFELDEPDCIGKYLYKSMGDTADKWQSPLFMPKKAARIWLEITDIGVERLQEISMEDCVKEGCGGSGGWEYSPDQQFQDLWESINGKESWESNPFVWCISFKRIPNKNRTI